MSELFGVAATLHHKLERIASIAVIMFAFGSVGCRIGPTRTASNPQISVSGSETWKIAERTWEVQETALLLFPEGESMLVVKALYDGRPGPQQSPLAQELARYALEQGYLDRARDKLRPRGSCEAREQNWRCVGQAGWQLDVVNSQ